MLNHIKYAAQISAKALVSWLSINIIGGVSTFLALIIGLFSILNNINVGHSGHASAAPALIAMALFRPLGSILLLLILLSPFLYFMLANQYTIKQVAAKLMQDKSEMMITPLLDTLLQKVRINQPRLLQIGADYTQLKLKLIDQIKHSSSNKWIRLVLMHVMQKLKLDDIDFQDKNIGFESILKLKVIAFLKGLSNPSLSPVIKVMALQWIFVGIILFVRY